MNRIRHTCWFCWQLLTVYQESASNSKDLERLDKDTYLVTYTCFSFGGGGKRKSWHLIVFCFSYVGGQIRNARDLYQLDHVTCVCWLFAKARARTSVTATCSQGCPGSDEKLVHLGGVAIVNRSLQMEVPAKGKTRRKNPSGCPRKEPGLSMLI